MEGARRNITFLIGEAYSYEPNVLADLDQAILAKANAALKVIIANVPIVGPASMGVILDEGPDLTLPMPNADSYTGQSPKATEDELLQKSEDAEEKLEEQTTRIQSLEAEVARLQEKHRVTVGECEQIFSDPRKQLFNNVSHSSKAEERFILIGSTDQGRILYVAFTIRNKRIRVISARDLNRKERYLYEKKA